MAAEHSSSKNQRKFRPSNAAKDFGRHHPRVADDAVLGAHGADP
jgi:hypothetical protein